MRLTLHADYGLRVLVYLATSPDRVVSTTEIGRAYGISKNHLVRVAQSLRSGGFIELSAGRTGGLSLSRPAADIHIGEVVRALEPDLRLVECFDAKTNTCPIAPACALARAIDEALTAFLASLDRFTVGDVVTSSGPTLSSHFIPIDALLRGRPARAGEARARPAAAPRGSDAKSAKRAKTTRAKNAKSKNARRSA